MEKLYSLIQKTPMLHKVALVGFLLVAIGAGHYFLIYTDQATTLKRLDKQLAKLDEELQEKMEIAGNLSKYKKRVEFLEQKLEEKKKNLPNDANMDQLLKTLNELSEKSDIRIQKFTPMVEVRRNFYAEIPVQMQIEGNYHEIATFFDKISKEERIINVSNIELGTPKEKSGKIVLRAACQAKTFRAMPEALKRAAKGKPARRKKH